MTTVVSLAARRACCYQNRRYSATLGDQVLVQRQAVHARHAHIEYQTRGAAGLIGAEELLGGTEYGSGETVRTQHALQRLADRPVVVNNRN